MTSGDFEFGFLSHAPKHFHYTTSGRHTQRKEKALLHQLLMYMWQLKHSPYLQSLPSHHLIVHVCSFVKLPQHKRENKPTLTFLGMNTSTQIRQSHKRVCAYSRTRLRTSHYLTQQLRKLHFYAVDLRICALAKTIKSSPPTFGLSLKRLREAQHLSILF